MGEPGFGTWERCPDCDELLMRDSGRCKNPDCPGKRDGGEKTSQ